MHRYPAIVFALILISTLTANAQSDDCELTLGRANEEFNNGHFTSIAAVLEPCMRSFTSEQKQRAYLLLTETYLLLDDASGAKASYLSLLKANPEFLTDTALHPIDVIYLSKKFTSTPIFSWLGKVGPNATIPRVIYDINQFGDDRAKEVYNIRPGYHISVGGDYNFSDKINARLELQFDHNVFDSHTNNYWTKDLKDVLFRQNWLSAPLTVTYGDYVGKYRPYGYLGYSFNYLLSEKMSVTLTNNRPAQTAESDPTGREDTPETSPDVSTRWLRNSINHSLVIGGGIKAKFGLDFLFIDLRYRFGLKNITSLDHIYDDGRGRQDSQDVSTVWANAVDIMRLDNLSISVGFLRPLYKPRELKRARTKSVMKQMKK